MTRSLIVVSLALAAAVAAAFATDNRRPERTTTRERRPERDKLLVIVIDGFRWDYLDWFHKRRNRYFPGFTEFRRSGVSTQYLKSVFPSESFATWQTINTGLYPGSHGIIADTFYDPTETAHNNEWRPKFFNPDYSKTTKQQKWWAKADPLWYTGKQQGRDFAMFLWGRCDVVIHGQKQYTPKHCENVFDKDDSKTLYINLDRALQELGDGVDAAFVYEDSLGRAARESGPMSTQVGKKLKSLDDDIGFLLKRLRETQMEKFVNVVILSDHGMTYGSEPIGGMPRKNSMMQPQQSAHKGVKKAPLSKALRGLHRDISMVVGSGAYSMVYLKEERKANEVADTLRQRLSKYDDIDVYTREDIPEELHWAHNPYCPPILILAKPGTVILRAGPQLQRPQWRQSSWVTGLSQSDTRNLLEQTQLGISGYDPEEQDMRGVFMARGPGFQKASGEIYPAIELVDVYQIFCHLLGIDAQPNDGVWERVKALLRNAAAPGVNAPSLMACLTAALVTRIFCG